MIEIPKCFRCIHYKNGKCKAYPHEIPLSLIAKEPKEKECGEGIRFKNKKAK